MKPDWDKLGKEFADSGKLVADVDCTAAGKSICEKHGVSGYPTLKYGDPSKDELEKYEGGRKYDDLKKHVEEKLGAVCSPANIGLCSAAAKKTIEAVQAIPKAELKAAIEKNSALKETTLSEWDTLVKDLTDRYVERKKVKEDAVAAVIASGLKTMKAVKAWKKSQ